MMKGMRVFSLAIAALMVLGAFTTVVLTTSSAQAVQIVDPEKLEFSPEMREKDLGAPAGYEDMPRGTTLGAYSPTNYYVVGESAKFYTWGYGKTNWIDVTKRGDGEFCEVWVGNDLTFPEGDPRNAYTSRITITDEMVAMAIAEFDGNIYPTEAQYFGLPDPLNGSESYWNYIERPDRSLDTQSDGKVIIMIMNIVDDNFYDPTYPSYIVGFFSPTVKSYYDRNVIHIDCWDWENRTGADSPRPFVYESTLAHEYQHLLHDALDSDEDSFINEGCSMYAEMLCGYGVPYDHINYYLYTPSNSLTVWGDQGDINILADYGAAALFTIYLNDHFGGASFVSALAHEQGNGIDGVNSALADAGYADWNFEKVFKFWKIANLVHSDFPGQGWYNYDSLDLDEYGLPVTAFDYYFADGMVARSNYLGEIYSLNGYSTQMNTLSGYGADYIRVMNPGLSLSNMIRLKFNFNGADSVPVGWSILPDMGIPGLAAGPAWWSGGGDLVDYALIGTLDLTAETEAMLAFNTYYDIEELWDFGFVQVSTDGGLSWTSVANEYTTDEFDPNIHPAIAANLPGLTGYNYGQMAFDLSAYVGQEIKVQFRYMTDWATYYDGWLINNITLNDVLIDDANTTIAFQPATVSTDFTVTVFAPMSAYRGVMLPARVMDVNLNDLNAGSASFATLSKYPVVYVIVSPTVGPVDYEFGTSVPTPRTR